MIICGEIGINHQGSLRRALEMIRVAKESGCNAVKLQTYYAESLCEKGLPFTYKSQGEETTEDMQEMFSRCQLKDHDWHIIKEECDNIGIEFMSTPMCKRSLDLLLDVGIKRIKVASSDLTNIPLLKVINETGLPVILSIGMADHEDLDNALAEFTNNQAVTIATCTAEYPTPPKDANISSIKSIRETLWKYAYISTARLLAGLSDHTLGNTAAIMAVAYGAEYFEKHFTLDNNLAGSDHWFSANPTQLKSWVNAIKEAQLMVGSGRIEPTEQEKVNREVWRKTEANGYVRKL